MFQIREMKEKDLDSVLQIEIESFISPWTKKDFLYELNENPFSVLLVVEENDSIIGFVDYMITFSSASINQIAVSKKYRKMGYGKALLDYVFNELSKGQDVDSVTLEVRENNLVARKFYENFGFRFIVIKPRYYSNGDNAIYMSKEIIYGNNSCN